MKNTLAILLSLALLVAVTAAVLLLFVMAPSGVPGFLYANF